MQRVMPGSLALAEAKDFCFETARLRCRLLSKDDQALYRSLYSNNTTMRYIMKPLTETSAEQSFFHALAYSQLYPVKRLFLPLESKDDGVGLGILGVSSINWRLRSLEYGLILTRAGQGKSYAIEVTAACLQHLSSRLGMRRIWVDISVRNIAALKVAHRAGFVPCRKNPRIHEFLVD